jgi:hypothetical protein
MEPRVAEEILTVATRRKIDAKLAQALAALSERVQPSIAATILSAAIARAKVSDTASHRLGMMRRTMGQADPVEALSSELAAVAKKLENAQATEVLLNALDQTKDAGARAALAEGMMAIAERMDRREAVKVRREAVEVIAVASARSAVQSMGQFGNRLVHLAEKLDPAEAAQILVKVMEQETNASIDGNLVQTLATIAAKLEPAPAAEILARAARRIASSLDKDTRTDRLGQLSS